MAYNPINLQPGFDPCWGEENDPPKPSSWREKLEAALWVAPVALTLGAPAVFVIIIIIYSLTKEVFG